MGTIFFSSHVLQIQFAIDLLEYIFQCSVTSKLNKIIQIEKENNAHTPLAADGEECCHRFKCQKLQYLFKNVPTSIIIAIDIDIFIEYMVPSD